MWFAYAIFTTLSWGAADLFYKKGSETSEKYSHLKTSVTVGLVMGIHAIATLAAKGVGYNPLNLLIYLPVSLMYILSMTVGYLGLRYLELSLSSPVQNSSGAVSCILCLAVLGQRLDMLSGAGVALICLGVIALGVLERRREPHIVPGEEKYTKGLRAFMLPVIYSILDALGTFLDAYYLDDFESTPLVGVTADNFEDVANISYELTFFITAVLLFIFVRIVKKEKFAFSGQKNRIVAALFETAGQASYVYAMSGRGVVAAPMIASYSIVSLILSRVFLKEKLSRPQYAAIVFVLIGIALLGIADV